MTDLIVRSEVIPAVNADRAETVLGRIQTIKADLMDRTIELGRLLKEVRDNGYYLQYGFGRFGDWVEQERGLDMGERNAYYAIKMVEFADKHQISDEQLKKVGISKMKELASLPDDTEGVVIFDLVKEAEEQPLSTIKEIVGVLKNTEYVYKTLRLPREFAETNWVDALERARRRYGSTMGFEGEVKDIDDWRALEVIFADFLSTPDFEETVDAYRILCHQVFERDGWKCRRCGSRDNLHPHHIQFRSQGGQDTMENLITLHNACHELLHNGWFKIYLLDAAAGANGTVEFDETMNEERKFS